jgi:hypothetical protein
MTQKLADGCFFQRSLMYKTPGKDQTAGDLFLHLNKKQSGTVNFLSTHLK